MDYSTLPLLFHIIITVIFITTTHKIKITVRKTDESWFDSWQGEVFCSPKPSERFQWPSRSLIQDEQGVLSPRDKATWA
jgi:hypothetical protein